MDEIMREMATISQDRYNKTPSPSRVGAANERHHRAIATPGLAKGPLTVSGVVAVIARQSNVPALAGVVEW
jgi:hypothetical protein